jgi:acyl dehydratase
LEELLEEVAGRPSAGRPILKGRARRRTEAARPQALVTGQSTIDLSMNVFANLGWDDVHMPSPVFDGDTIYSRSKVLETRSSNSRST